MPTLAAVATLARALPGLRDLPGLAPDDPRALAAVGLAPFDPGRLATIVTVDLVRLNALTRDRPLGELGAMTNRAFDAAARRYAAVALVISCLRADAIELYPGALLVADDFYLCDLWELLLAEDRVAFRRWLSQEEENDPPDHVCQAAQARLGRQVAQRAEATELQQRFAMLNRA